MPPPIIAMRFGSGVGMFGSDYELTAWGWGVAASSIWAAQVPFATSAMARMRVGESLSEAARVRRRPSSLADSVNAMSMS